MASVVIKFLAMGTAAKTQLTYGGSTVSLPITNQEWEEFKAKKNNSIAWFLGQLKPHILKAGFIFDPSLYAWELKRTNTSMQLWCTIKFIDDMEMGKTAFMAMIRKTNILDLTTYSIIKSYS